MLSVFTVSFKSFCISVYRLTRWHIMAHTCRPSLQVPEYSLYFVSLGCTVKALGIVVTCSYNVGNNVQRLTGIHVQLPCKSSSDNWRNANNWMAWCKRDIRDFFRWNFFSFKSAWIFACAFQWSSTTFPCIFFTWFAPCFWEKQRQNIQACTMTTTKQNKSISATKTMQGNVFLLN